MEYFIIVNEELKQKSMIELRVTNFILRLFVWMSDARFKVNTFMFFYLTVCGGCVCLLVAEMRVRIILGL